jgi:uncharacterized protein (DUF433 family)
VATLRQQLSLQHIRAVIDRVRAEYDQPLTELRLAVDRGRLYFRHPDGSWEDGKNPGHLVMARILMLDKVRADLRNAAAGQALDVGHIERRRKVLGSKPILAGTRIPVTAVGAYLERGASDAEIIAEYPQLTTADIDAVRARQAAV